MATTTERTRWVYELDVSDVEQGLDAVLGKGRDAERALDDVGTTGQQTGGKLGNLGKVAKVALAAGLAAGATAAAAGVVKLASEVLALSGRLDNLAKRAKDVGGTASELDTVRRAFGLLGLSAETTDAGLLDLRKQAVLAKNEMAALGLTAQDLESLPLPERLLLIAQRLGKVDSASERAAITSRLFGRAGKEITKALEDGGPALAAAIDQVTKYGTVSDDAAAAAEALQDETALASQALQFAKDQGVAPLIPAATELAKAVGEVALQVGQSDALITYSNLLADVVTGAVLAARAVRLLNREQQDQDKRTREAARAQIDAQSEQIEEIKRRLEFQKATDEQVAALTNTTDYQSEATRNLTAELERQVDVLRKLKGELGDDAGLLSAADVLRNSTGADAGGGGGGAPAAAPAPAAAAPAVEKATDAVDEYAAAWDAARQALTDFDGLASDIEGRRLSASERLIAAHEREQQALQDQLLDTVAQESLTADQRYEIIQRAAGARLMLEQDLYAQLEQLRQQDLENEEAATEERTTLWQDFQATWSDGLSSIVNASAAAASQILGEFRRLAQDTMRERVDAAKETQDILAGVEEALTEATSDGEERRLKATKIALRKQAAEQKRAALEAFETQKALSIVQASIQTALAVVNAIATAPNIIAGLALAGVATALGVAQIAIIASQEPPKFHRGGMVRASDMRGASQDAVPATLRPGEGVLSPQGVARAGGPAAVDALNGGAPLGGGSSVMLVRVGTRTTEEIAHQQLRSNTGRMASAFRGVRPKVGRATQHRR